MSFCGGCQSKPSYGWVHDKHVNFLNLQTYQWLGVEQKGTAGRYIMGQPIDQLVQQDVQRVLTAKGFKPVRPESAPHFTVQCTTVLQYESGESSRDISGGDDSHLESNQWYAVESSGSSVHPEVPQSYAVGTIYITMRDPKTNHILWRGVASSVLDEKSSQDKRAQRLHEAVQTLMAKFPPPEPAVR
jgi:hypothetical protein